MKAQIENRSKDKYIAPQIEHVELDNEISLVLQSAPSGTPPFGPGETVYAPEYFKNDPFKTNRG